MQLNPIGFVKSSIDEGIDYNWGEITSEIHILESLAHGLSGLKEFSHIIVIFYMHRAMFILEKNLTRHPRGREDMPLIGIFAQRAKHRPNPIGITTVPILSIKDNILTVQGLDAIDGTPVLDIKPYFPIFDKVDAKTPPWVNELMKGYFE
ncbi:MAG: tRNA (N6-threonylcarbamoyladenosine(37)-N6)-methyltransferase TrmO [Candidatus Hodarchaeales archaeon]|jgi:tRNA-Thr(GGU) m(6)t(6)A37 methyltransferase TsaA